VRGLQSAEIRKPCRPSARPAAGLEFDKK